MIFVDFDDVSIFESK